MMQLLGAVYFAIFSIPLVVIDIRERRLPNRITLPGLAITLAGVLLAGDWGRALVAVACGFVLFVVGVAISLKRWLGMGDVKLLTSLVMILGWYGWQVLLLGLAASFTFAGVVVLVRFALKQITASSTIALGPYLLGGFWFVVIPQVWSSIAR
jgi:leader peptidase (prepilin peptidase)/N-methyltransferase